MRAMLLSRRSLDAIRGPLDEACEDSNIAVLGEDVAAAWRDFPAAFLALEARIGAAAGRVASIHN